MSTMIKVLYQSFTLEKEYFLKRYALFHSVFFCLILPFVYKVLAVPLIPLALNFMRAGHYFPNRCVTSYQPMTYT